jgi:hypothetical protein
MVAYKVAQTGNQENSLDILIKFIPKYIHNQNFIYDLFLAVADDARLNKSDQFNMGNMSGFPASITINEVANKYKQLIDDWNKKHDKIDSRIAIEADTFAATQEPQPSFAKNLQVLKFVKSKDELKGWMKMIKKAILPFRHNPAKGFMQTAAPGLTRRIGVPTLRLKLMRTAGGIMCG